MNPTNPGPMNPTNPGPMNPTNPGPKNPTNPGPMTPTNPGPMTPTNTGPMTPTNTGPMNTGPMNTGPMNNGPMNTWPMNTGLATGIVDMSNGQAQFKKHLGEMGMGIGVHGMSGGKVTFGRTKYGRQSTGPTVGHTNFNPTNPTPPMNPLATGVVDMSNGQVQFNKHMGELGMGIGVHGMDGGSVTFGRSANMPINGGWTGISNLGGFEPLDGLANFNFEDLLTPLPPTPSSRQRTPPNSTPPMNPMATGVVDMSNGQVQFNKHLGEL